MNDWPGGWSGASGRWARRATGQHGLAGDTACPCCHRQRGPRRANCGQNGIDTARTRYFRAELRRCQGTAGTEGRVPHYGGSDRGTGGRHVPQVALEPAAGNGGVAALSGILRRAARRRRGACRAGSSIRPTCRLLTSTGTGWAISWKSGPGSRFAQPRLRYECLAVSPVVRDRAAEPFLG